ASHHTRHCRNSRSPTATRTHQPLTARLRIAKTTATIIQGQRDAAAAGAERAIFVTLSRFTEPARRAATISTPTVDLIDGEKLCDLALKQEIGIVVAPRVDTQWFDRFDR
ncbi:MAG: restriction endonuclease, partial [Actinomycetota bacterium]|nr:restriction endonuclease [Actinomycetota bacterium]